jgi:hypothetical protein
MFLQLGLEREGSSEPLQIHHLYLPWVQSPRVQSPHTYTSLPLSFAGSVA